jgi:hypothetical protein
MGMFKDIREIRRRANTQPKLGLRKGLKATIEALDQADAYTSQMGSQGLSDNLIANMAALSQGIAGSGEVVATRGTGEETMGTPVYDVDLMVTVTGREPYQVTHRQMIAPASLGNWRTGTIYPVRVSPTDPSQVMIG